MNLLKFALLFVGYVASIYVVGYLLHLTGLFGERESESLALLRATLFASIFTVGFYLSNWYKERKIKKG